jgi:hypothetical protein
MRWLLLILCTGSQFYNAPRHQQNWGESSFPHRKDCGCMQNAYGLCPHVSQRHHPILRSDAAYFLVLPNARSRYAGHYFLSNNPPSPPAMPNPKPNGAILTVCKTLPGVMSSAAEAETGGVYWNGQDTIVCRTPFSLWDTPDHLLLSRLTILQPTALFIQTFVSDALKLGTCVGTGYVTRSRTNSSASTGTKVKTTTPTTSPNIIPQYTIYTCALNMF